MVHNTRMYLSTLILCLFLVACATETRLKPAPGALTIGEDKVFDSVRGVEVTANPDAWRGRPEITDVVVPIRVTIRNHSESPIMIRNRLFSLTRQEDRESFAALQPGEITGSVVVARPSPYRPPVYGGGPFYPFGAPYYGYYPGPFGYPHHGRYYYRDRIPLPTEEMLQGALEEGRLAPGEEVTGFLFFPAGAVEGATPPAGVRFRMDLLDERETGLGEITLPFVIERG